MQDLKVTLLQSDLHWENAEKNLLMFDKKLAGIEQADLIILPEMFNSGFTMNVKNVAEKCSGKTMQWLSEKAKEKNSVITGSLIIEEDGKFYNRLIWMEPSGNYKKYDKRHLFRMGEEHLHFSPGNEKLIVELNGWKICPLICYDLRFPVWSRNRKKLAKGSLQFSIEYDVLIYIANWPERRNHAWKTLLLARTIENQSYVIGVNRVGIDATGLTYSGDSAAINLKGEIITGIKPNEDTFQTLTLSRSDLEEFRKSFPVAMDADEFEIKL